MNSKHGTSIKSEPEPETFKPNLREPSDLLEMDQIEKVESQHKFDLMQPSTLTCTIQIDP